MRKAPLATLAAALLAATALAACGKGGGAGASNRGPVPSVAPVATPGAVSVATRNTTRLGGDDPIADAAAVARAVYPGLTPATRPQAVVLVSDRDWAGALAASVLAGAPAGAPLLFSEGNSLPQVSQQALEAMHPSGLRTLEGAQVIRIGRATPSPSGYVTRTVASGEPAAAAVAVAEELVAADGSPPKQVIVLPADLSRALQMPAAGLAAESGAPILFVTQRRVPPVTATVLRSMHRPSIYVIGSPTLSRHALGQLSHLGSVTLLADATAPAEREGAASNAIAIARFIDGGFGWGVKEPGHGLVFANASRPLDGPAAAALSASGDYGPLLLLESATQVPPVLAGYLGDIQPAYTSAPQFRPVRGVYNHGWLIGDEHAISPVTQAEIDSVLEISPRKSSPSSAEEPSVTTPE